jgi:CheY-like chemotaxis protein
MHVHKILLVDNISSVLEREKTMLDRKDFQIFTATRGDEALEIHAKEKVDVIIMDLRMPGMSGDELCRKVRASNDLKRVSIIMATLSDDPKELALCKASGANVCLQKPLRKDDVMAALSKFLDVPRRQSIRILVRVKMDGLIGGEFFIANTVDVSATGLLFECERQIAIGNTVEASFFLPGNGSFHRIVANSEIVRVVPGDTGKEVRYGVTFREFKEGSSDQISTYVTNKTAGK